MKVPAIIRAVARPKNTVVENNGRPGPNQYPVRERAGITYVPGGNPKPRNGKVIGHIINHQYVPIHKMDEISKPTMLSYGSSAFVHSVSQDLLDDLLAVYQPEEAFSIMSIASLRVIRPSVTNSRMSAQYEKSFISEFYPGAALSTNTVSRLLQKIGQDGQRRKQFYDRRIAATAAEHHVAIDGTLKQDTSTVNDLSHFSYKGRVKGRKELSVLYAYDIERMEPICAEVFPGNSIDASSYPAFIKDNDIRNGIIVADKGFPPSKIKAELEDRPNLHFLTPIKRNDVRIANNHMLDFEGVLCGIEKRVLYKKAKIKGGHFLYAFKDASLYASEEAAFLNKAKFHGSFDPAKYERKRETFGVMVLESDRDMPPETAYQCYDDRWKLELVFRRYKSDECLDKTGAQGDFTVIGSEFVNFLSTVMTCRMLAKAKDCGLLKEMSYGELMEDLNEVWRKIDAPEYPRTDDGGWVHTLKLEFDELERLGLSQPIPQPEKKKRGRPKKNQDVITKPKRPRGRPMKDASEACL